MQYSDYLKAFPECAAIDFLSARAFCDQMEKLVEVIVHRVGAVRRAFPQLPLVTLKLFDIFNSSSCMKCRLVCYSDGTHQFFYGPDSVGRLQGEDDLVGNALTDPHPWSVALPYYALMRILQANYGIIDAQLKALESLKLDDLNSVYLSDPSDLNPLNRLAVDQVSDWLDAQRILKTYGRPHEGLTN